MTPPVSSPRRGLLAAGNFIIDQVKVIDQWPRQDSLVHILEHSRANGGGPYNVLKDLAAMRCGLPLAALALIGDDPDGAYIRADLERSGIDASRLRATAAAATSTTDVMTVKTGGRRTFFHHKGANALLAPEHFDFSGSTHRIFYLGYLMLLDALDRRTPDGTTGFAQVLQAARAQGLITIADAVTVFSDDFTTVCKAAFPHLDYLILNELEAGQITGNATLLEGHPDPIALREAAHRIHGWGTTRAVYIHYREGAYCQTRDGAEFSLPSLNVPPDQIAGTVGAGDAFCAGIVYGIHEAMDIPDQLRLAACTAAACLLHSTPSEGLRDLPSCLKLADTYGFTKPA